jgi:hypothetical protein
MEGFIKKRAEKKSLPFLGIAKTTINQNEPGRKIPTRRSFALSHLSLINFLTKTSSPNIFSRYIF